MAWLPSEETIISPGPIMAATAQIVYKFPGRNPATGRPECRLDRIQIGTVQ